MTTPFDPRTAGWVECAADCHAYDREYNGTDGLGCPACDGLGIVVGPPEDGLEIARLVVGSDLSLPMAPWGEVYGLIRLANGYKRL